jgi:hypothetical protein
MALNRHGDIYVVNAGIQDGSESVPVIFRQLVLVLCRPAEPCHI